MIRGEKSYRDNSYIWGGEEGDKLTDWMIHQSVVGFCR
jgi:hypothetical protein